MTGRRDTLVIGDRDSVLVDVVAYGADGSSVALQLSSLDAGRLAHALANAATRSRENAVARSRDGVSLVTRGDLISPTERDGLARTSCGLICYGCGAVLATELDFADHFVIGTSDIRNGHWNLAECPDKRRAGATA